jgi:aspartate/methionine/tyrosine aminotransferase
MSQTPTALGELIDSRVLTSEYPDIDWIAEYRSQGEGMGDPILLAMGENWAGPDPELIQLLAVAPSWTHGYQLALAGAPSVRHRLSEYVRSQHRLTHDGTMVALVHGGTRSAMRQLAQAIVARSAHTSNRPTSPHLVTLSPGWEYGDALAPSGYSIEQVALDPVDGFAAPVELINERLTAASGQFEPVVIAINPHQNPCGDVWTESSVREVAETAAATGAWLLIDDAYFGLAVNQGPSDVLSAAQIAEDVLGDEGRWFAVRSLGKQLQANGWGAGVAIGPSSLIEHWVHQVRAAESYGISAMIHWAIGEYLGTPAELAWTSQLKARVERNRRAVVDALHALDLAPSSGSSVPYVLFRAPRGLAEGAIGFCADLARRTGVVLTPASSAQSLSDMVRMYVGADAPVVDEAIRRISIHASEVHR